MSYILVLDDETMIQNLFKTLLKLKLGTEVQTAYDPDEAIALVEVESPLAVVLDLNLKKDSGLYFLDWIKNREGYKDIPIVVVSAMHQDQIIEKVKEKGVADIFSKIDVMGPGKEQEDFLELLRVQLSN